MNSNLTARIFYTALLIGLNGCNSGTESANFENPFSSPGVQDSGISEEDESADRFQDVGTNPFTMVDHDPLSTFAADVDTASYDIFVRDIEDETLPDPLSVRLEEFVNFFDYDYEAPEVGAEHPFALGLKASAHPFRDTMILRVGMQAVMPPPEEKRPTNLVFLVDISGSMTSADKLPLVKQVLNQTLDLLDETDTISIVTYAGSTGVALEPTPISQRGTIESVIDSFSASGSTAGAAGIDLAYEQAEAAFLEGGTNHVLLCTDGDFNVGPASTEELVDLIEVKRETGITLTVLGFGSGNLNDAMMELISNKGNGIYGVISSVATATQYVEERMLSSFNLIAKDVKLQVEFNPEYVSAYRLLGYENRAIADDDFREDGVDAGEIGAGHQVTGLYELVLAGNTIPAGADDTPPVDDGDAFEGTREVDPSDMVLVKIRYKQPSATSADPATEINAALSPEAVLSTFDASDADFSWAVMIAAFAEILKESPYADAASLGGLQDIIAADPQSDANRQAFARHFQSARNMLSN